MTATQRALSSILVIVLAGCTEPRAPQQAPAPNTLEARLDFSDSSATTGRAVLVTVRATGGPLASITGRLTFDTTALAFSGEQSLDDGATRMANPTPGEARFAAIAPQGIQDGRLYVFAFTPLKANGLSSLKLVIDEAHTADRADASKSLIRRSP